MTRLDTLTGEMQAMVGVARRQWHRYIELRRWAAEAERANDFPKFIRWKTRARLCRASARRHLNWAFQRKAEIEAISC